MVDDARFVWFGTFHASFHRTRLLHLTGTVSLRRETRVLDGVLSGRRGPALSAAPASREFPRAHADLDCRSVSVNARALAWWSTYMMSHKTQKLESIVVDFQTTLESCSAMRKIM